MPTMKEKLPGCAAPLTGSHNLCQSSWVPPHASFSPFIMLHSRKTATHAHMLYTPSTPQLHIELK